MVRGCLLGSSPLDFRIWTPSVKNGFSFFSRWAGVLEVVQLLALKCRLARRRRGKSQQPGRHPQKGSEQGASEGVAQFTWGPEGTGPLPAGRSAAGFCQRGILSALAMPRLERQCARALAGFALGLGSFPLGTRLPPRRLAIRVARAAELPGAIREERQGAAAAQAFSEGRGHAAAHRLLRAPCEAWARGSESLGEDGKGTRSCFAPQPFSFRPATPSVGWRAVPGALGEPP